MDVVLFSTYLSVVMQIISGIVQFDGIFIHLKEKDRILTDILSLETIVQFIEGLFYVWLVMNFSNNYPVVYGFTSIILVILIGVSFSYVRELIHYIRYDMSEKKYKFFN